MKGQIYKKITTTVVAAAMIAATLTTDTADVMSVCAQEVSSGDSAIQETPNEINTQGQEQAPDEIQVEPAVQAENVQEQESPASPDTDASAPVESEGVSDFRALFTPIPAAEQEEPALAADPVIGPDLTVEGVPTATYEYGGTAYNVTVNLDSAITLDDGVTYEVKGTVEVSAKNVIDDTFDIADLSNVTVVNKDTSETVTPASLKVHAKIIQPKTITARSMDLIKVYDGSPLENRDTPLAEDSGWVGSEGANYTFSGSQTAIGDAINRFEATSGKDGTDLNNYVINYTYGSIKVLERPEDQKYILTVEGNNATAKYNGKDQIVTGYVLEGRSDSEFQVNGTGDPSQVFSVTIGNAVFSVTGIGASASGKNAGTYTVNITGAPVVRDSEGTDVTSQFKFEFRPGKLEIEKRNLVLTSASLTKKYTTKTISKHKVTVSGDGFAEGEGATYSFSGKQKGVGESYNYFTYKLNDGTLADNYEIEKVPGKLKIKKQEDTAINEEPQENNTESAQEQQQTQDTPATEASKPVEQKPSEPSATATDLNNPNVLGAQRGEITIDIKKPKKSKKKSKRKKKKEIQEVLGARRGATEDTTDMGRHVLVFAAAVIFMAALKIKRKKSVRK